MVIASYHVCDLHQRIVHHDRKIIGGIAVRTKNDEIVEHIVVKNNFALDQVVDYRLAFQRRFESQRGLSGRLADAQLSAAPVISRRKTLRLRLFSPSFQFLGCAYAPIGLSSLEERHRMAVISVHALCLSIRPLVPPEAHPFQSFQNRLNRFVRRTALIGVFNAQDEDTLLLFGKEPIEQGGADSADVKEAGRTGRKSHTDLGHGKSRRGWPEGGYL